MNDEQRQPTDAEVEAKLKEEIKRLRVADVAGEVMVTLVTLGYQKLGLTRETLELRHLPDARLAIELLRGLIETLEREIAGDVQAFRSTLAAMQLEYARVAALPEGELPGGGGPEAPVAGAPEGHAANSEGEPERPGATVTGGPEGATVTGEPEGATVTGEPEGATAGAGEPEGPTAGAADESAGASGESTSTRGEAGAEGAGRTSRAAGKLWVPPSARGKKRSS